MRAGLVGKGFIKLQNFRGSRNKLTYAYLLTPVGVAAKSNIAVGFLQIKMAGMNAFRKK